MGGITYRLHPDGRLYALYLRSVGLLWVVGGILYHTHTNKGCWGAKYIAIATIPIYPTQIKVALSCNRLFATLFVTRRLR